MNTTHYHEVRLADRIVLTLELDVTWRQPEAATAETPGTDWAIIDTKISNVYLDGKILQAIHPVLMDALEYYVEKLQLTDEVRGDWHD